MIYQTSALKGKQNFSLSLSLGKLWILHDLNSGLSKCAEICDVSCRPPAVQLYEFGPVQLTMNRQLLFLLVFFFIYSWIHASYYESVEITNKMQPCNRIYYSKIYWRLDMFRAAHRSSLGAPNCICSLWFIYTCGDRPLSRLSGNC